MNKFEKVKEEIINFFIENNIHYNVSCGEMFTNRDNLPYIIEEKENVNIAYYIHVHIFKKNDNNSLIGKFIKNHPNIHFFEEYEDSFTLYVADIKKIRKKKITRCDF